MDGLSIIKFPRTPHLSGSYLTDPDDRKVSYEKTLEVLSKPLLVQEKLDGANIGISFQEETGLLLLQSRGHYLEGGDHPQFDYLKGWAWSYYEELYKLIGSEHIAYGELLHIRHTVPYTRLPSFVVLFDLYIQATKEFVDSATLRAEVERCFGAGSSAALTPPVVAENAVLENLDNLSALLTASAYGDTLMEGFYLRREVGGKTLGRYKYVRQSFKDELKNHDQEFKRRMIKNELVVKNA